ncbi:MAG: DMT family transporter [Hyphomicrobiales bacterium]
MMKTSGHYNSSVLPGVVIMCLGVACLGINDAIAKALADHYSPIQILFMRNVVALPIALLLAIVMQGPRALYSTRPVVHLVRGVFWVLATVLFFTSIKHVGLAKSTALLLASPLLIVAVSSLFLGEKTGLKTWGAVISGLIGALIIVRPGLMGFDPLALLALLAALMAAFLMLSARWVDEAESFWTLMLYLTASSALIGGLAVPFFWVPLQTQDLVLFVGVAAFGTAGMVLMTQAFRIAPASVVAPLDYTALLWATLFGWLFWSEIPDLLTYFGAAVIVLSGIVSSTKVNESS